MPWLMILVLLLALLLFGIGFTLKVLWIIAAIVLIVWLLGFVARGTGPSGRRGRWYRW
ncbi:hydrophobic protein [Actinomadura sp. NPDC048394]|uniref:hydrophobic protein n=1 Tax=Actinomadura sp. NPDC048394 TaxID=3158223 RepID=UPI0033EB06AF